MAHRIHSILLSLAVSAHCAGFAAPAFADPAPDQDNNATQPAQNDAAAKAADAQLITDFHNAVIKDDVWKIKTLLQSGMDVNSRGEKGRTALMYACWYNRSNAVNVLLQAGADASLKDDNGYTALDYAASKGHVGEVEYLTQNMKLPDTNDDLDYAKLIYTANTDTQNDFFKGMTKLDYINRISAEGAAPIHIAAAKGYLNTVKQFVDLGADINLRANGGYTPLEFAAWNNRADVIGFLLSKGAALNGDPDKPSPLVLAIENRSANAAKLLIEKGADLNAKDAQGISAKLLGLESGNPDIRKAVAAKDPAPINKNEVNKTLQDALAPGHINAITVHEALAYGADPNIPDAQGRTALHKAVLGLSPEAVSCILEHHANVDAKDSQGRTPLMSVGETMGRKETDQSEPVRLEIARLLVDKGADVNAADNYGASVLACLSSYDLPKVIEFLLEHGARVDQPDNNGRTPLLRVAENGKTEIAQLLLKHGANPNLKPGHVWSPMEAAIHFKHQDIVQAMTEAAKLSTPAAKPQQTTISLHSPSPQATLPAAVNQQ